MQTYTWYTNTPNLDSPGTIHQILAYGNLASIKELLDKRGQDVVREIFMHSPQKVYTPAAFHFVAQYILHMKGPIDESRYLKTTPRIVG